MTHTAQKDEGRSGLSHLPMSESDQERRSLGRKKSGFILLSFLSILSGSVLLLENLGVGSFQGVHKLWPVFPLLLGAGFLVLFKQRRPLDLVLFSIGIYLCGASVLFFICCFYGWHVMVKAWPFFVGLAGLTAVLTSYYTERLKRFLLLSGTFFMFLSLAFFLIFNVSPTLWPGALVILGIWLFVLVNI
jgi:hypothetical protein